MVSRVTRLLSITALASACLLARPASAQLMSNGANWGVTFGIDAVSSSYNPHGGEDARGKTQLGFATRGWGISGNLGVVFLKHYMLGGDVGAVWFGGDRTLIDPNGQSAVAVTTTNSLSGSAYVGLITSPLGRNGKLGRKWWFGGKFGSAKWGGERRLAGCVGCSTDNPMHMVSGAYVEPFVVFGGGDRDGGGGFRLAYRQSVFPVETIRSAVTFGFFFDLLKP
jgi:hypothetical protein